jgi:hypothetical protein
MTLIIKELIIRGIVTKDSSGLSDETIDKEELYQYLDEMKRSINKDCIDNVLGKLNLRKIR